MLYEKPANEFVRDFVGRTLLFKGKVQSGNPSGQLAIALEGAPDCVVFGRTYHPDGIKTGAAVYIGVRPEDVEILPANGTTPPSGMIGGTAQAALFIGERIEYQVEVEGQERQCSSTANVINPSTKAVKSGSSCAPTATARGRRIGRLKTIEKFGELMNTLRKPANEYLPRWFGSVLFFFLSASSAFGAAATANFEQEWSKLITAAQQEGTLSIASGGAPSRQYRPVVDAFSKKFNIKVEVSTGNATDTVNRVLAERKGRQVYRRRGVDQLARKSAALGAVRLVDADCRHCYFIPKSSTCRSGTEGKHMYADKFSKFALIYHAGLEDQYEIWYNTEKIKEAEIATLVKQTDVFDPDGKAKSPAKAWATRPAFAK